MLLAFNEYVLVAARSFGGSMVLEKNAHVQRMNRFQPFSADAAELVHEQSDPGEASFQTSAWRYVIDQIENLGVKMIILTGDAGHGKTHLCAKVLERCGLKPSDAATIIRDNAQAGGYRELARTPGQQRPLRIAKDLSDLTVVSGARLLEHLTDLNDDSISIVCANEGRLRRAVGAGDRTRLSILTSTLERGLREGTCSSLDGSVLIVNLNFQSIVRDDGRGLADWALNSWASDRRKWRICQGCDARQVCPIVENHRLLSDHDDGPRRRERLKALLATAERAGTVITIRQTLSTLAYAVTGGLNCTDVHRRYRHSRGDSTWQSKHLYHQAAFGDELSASQREEVAPFAALRRIDPGTTALREVDDVIDLQDRAERFQPDAPSLATGTPRSRRDAQRDSEYIRSLMRFLRRRSFFDESTSEDLYRRIGIRSGNEFERAAKGEISGRSGIRTRDSLLRGLEAVQGVRRGSEVADFLVLDPAFANHRNRAAVVGRSIPSRAIEVRGQLDHWSTLNLDLSLPSAVDWLSRNAVIEIAGEVSIAVDLFRFELLRRWAAGLSARTEHAAAIRFINGLLARLVPDVREEDEILVLVGGERRSLSIDLGEQIRSGSR